MKKWLLMCLFLMLTLVLVACSSDDGKDGSEDASTNQGNSNSENTNSSGNTEQNQAQTVVLKSTVQSPQGAALSRSFDALLDFVEEKSNGEIKFERYYGDSLVKPADVTDSVSAGIADIAFIIPDNTAKANPLFSINSLPSLWSSSYAGSMSLNKLMVEFPDLENEFTSRNVKPLSAIANSPYYYFSAKDMSSMDDVKGQKTIATGSFAFIADAMGGVPVAVQTPESYEALERKTVDSTIASYGSSQAFSLFEVVKTVYEMPLSSPGSLIAINKTKYESLSDSAQSALWALNEAAPKMFHELYEEEFEGKAKKAFEDNGVKILEPSEEDRAKFNELMKTKVWGNYTKTTGAKGEEILNRALELAKQYDAEYESLYGKK